MPPRWLSHATEPRILYPAIAVLMLAGIWGTTLNLVRVENDAAERAVAATSRELADTYEAQIVRALREIDQTLKLVKYAYELRGRQFALRELKARALLPPDLLFVVSVADSNGEVVASTRGTAWPNVAGEAYFQIQRQTESFAIDIPRRDPGSGEWKLQFSRRIDAPDGTFSGIVVVAVDAAYFVSAYEASKLGERGVLGILGTDGVFRVRRSAEKISAGDVVDYAAVVPATGLAPSQTRLSTNVWDGERRYTSVRKLYDFPLAVIAGLSSDEQLATVRRERRNHLWKALVGSLVLGLVLVVLGRLSAQLAAGRLRAAEEQAAHAERVEYLAYHDGLTTLPNRSLFSKLLGQSITQAHRYKRQLAVLFLDLDRFKHINDTLGHEAGDQLLQQLATRLKACLRDSDTVARLGGDEFVALLPQLEEEKYVATVAQKVLAAVARPFLLLGQELRVTASIGISTYPQDGLDEQTLTKNADIAMYQAKELGKNNFQFYSEQLDANSLERLALESGLRQAVERKEFVLHYQARRDIRSGRITAVEALLRWQRPGLGTVAPLQFIPLAEEIGLIVPIGKWVLRTACAQAVAWRNQGLPPLGMAVNLTARQFTDENLLADLAQLLAQTGMDASGLELEITEGLLLRDVDKTVRILNGLTAMGIRIAIDHFGIGYSSLATLRQFPVNTIKIDRSFTRDAASVAQDKGLTEAIIAMGRALGVTVVAQGVETSAQADFLRGSSCDEFQGFYFNQPLPAPELGELLRGQPLA